MTIPRGDRKPAYPEIEFATKPKIATGQLREARQSGVPDGIGLADAGYGDDTSLGDPGR